MKFCEVKYLRNSATYDDLVEHLTLCSSEFIPPLDSYVDINIYARKINKFAVTFEAWHNENLIGLAAVYYNNQESRIGFLTNLSLLKNCQRMGIATHLMFDVIKYGKELEFIYLHLQSKISNEHAVAFYEKLGFIRIGKIKDCYTMSYKLYT